VKEEEEAEPMTTTPTVLFVCLHGSAKSLIALEHFRRLAQQQGVDVQADWAGIEPDAEIPLRVVQGLLGEGIDVRGRRPRQVTRADLEHATRVVTLGCELGALESAGLARERWDDVPAVSEDFKKARDVIVARLPGLLDAVATS
jgi:arsenate reductase